MVQKDTDSQLNSQVSEDTTLLQTSGKQQSEVLDDHLVPAVREQQQQMQELLEGELAAFMAAKSRKGISPLYLLISLCSTMLGMHQHTSKLEKTCQYSL